MKGRDLDLEKRVHRRMIQALPLGALVDLFFSVFPSTDGALEFAQRAGLPLGYVNANGAPIDVWTRLLAEADRRKSLERVVDRAALEFPDVSWSQALLASRNAGKAEPVVGRDVKWHAQRGSLEKVMADQPTFLPIAFLEKGTKVSRSVVRIVCPDGSKGTGFLTNENLIVTNHHVIASSQEAEHSRIEFNAQQSSRGTFLEVVAFDLDPNKGFATSPATDGDDWTIIRVKGDANQDWGAISLADSRAEVNGYVNIIQHPEGGPKQVALYHNVVAYVDDRRIQYMTDTMPGSSGAPVFDSEWEVVALHHAGGWLAEPSTKRVHFRNEGIAVHLIVDGRRKTLA